MSEITPQFVLYKDRSNEWRWKLYSKNNKVIADSAEGYHNKQDCIHGARLVMSVAPGASIWDAVGETWV